MLVLHIPAGLLERKKKKPEMKEVCSDIIKGNERIIYKLGTGKQDFW